VQSLSHLPRKAEIGDLAILSSGEAVSGYFLNAYEIWEPDTGYRVLQKKPLVHFPAKEWQRWILHGDHDALHWEFDDTARGKIKKDTSSTGESASKSQLDRNIKDSGRVPSHSSKANTPSPTTPSILSLFTPSPAPPATNKPNAAELLSDIILYFSGIFSDSPETFGKCAGPLIQLVQRDNGNAIPIARLGDAKEDGLLPGRLITMSSLYNDLMRNEDELSLNIQDSFRVTGNKTTGDLLTAMSSDSKGLRGSRFPVILGAHNVPAHPRGTKDIKILPPSFLQNSGVSSPVPNGFTDNTAVLTSHGFLTEPHWDFYGIPQIVVHGGGAKLWLVWPPTPENLKKASEFLFSVEKLIDFTITRALEELNDLEIRFCTQQDEYFILPPCAIHAVITVKASGHKNKLFVDYGYFDVWDQGYSLIIESLKLEHQQVHDCSRKDAIIEEILESRKAFLHWESLLKQKYDHPSASKTRARLNEIKEETEVHLKSLGYVFSSRKRRSPSPVIGQNRKRAKKGRK
jgi:hypothetical protein